MDPACEKAHATASPGGELRLVLLLAASAFVLYALLGHWLHPYPIGGPELDGYVPRARQLYAGLDAGDGCHPFGLPALLALLMHVGIDPAVGARLCAALGGGLLVACTYVLARRFAGRAAALAAAVGTGLCELTVVHAQLESSDMPAAGVLALAFVCWTRAADPGAARPLRAAWFGGLWLGVATSLRFPSLFAAAGALPLLLHGPLRPRAGTAFALGSATLLGLLPHLVLAARAYGSPWYNENWRNLVLKYEHGFDVHRAALDHAKAPELLRTNAMQWAGRALGDVVHLLRDELARVFATPVAGVAATVLSLAVAALLVGSAVATRRDRRVLAWAGLATAVCTAVTFAPSGRYLLPLLPIVPPLLLGVCATGQLGRLPTVFGVAWLAAALLLLPGGVRRFVAAHDGAAFAAARELARAAPGPLNVQLVRHVEDLALGAHVVVQLPPPPELADSPEGLWRHLAATAAANASDIVVIGREDAPDLVQQLLAVPPPAGFEVLRRDDVLVVRCPPAACDWLARATAHSDGTLVHVAVELDADSEAARDVLFVYAFVRDGAVWLPVQLRQQDETGRHFADTVATAVLPHDGSLVPALLRRTGALLHAPPLAVSPARERGGEAR